MQKFLPAKWEVFLVVMKLWRLLKWQRMYDGGVNLSTHFHIFSRKLKEFRTYIAFEFSLCYLK